MAEYPTLVAMGDWRPQEHDTLVCLGSCQREWREDPSDGCLECTCGGVLEDKYQMADRCPGCGRLGFCVQHGQLDGCCSRACQLQAEYAQSLAKP